MIIYDLVCDTQHRFEGWFKNTGEYATQLSGGLLSCPICGSTHVHKVLSVSHVNTGTEVHPAETGLTAEARPQEILKKLHEYIEQRFHNVGAQFAEEARRIHYGETEERNIYGQATGIEIKELREEGINAVPLPEKPGDKSNLN